MKITRENYEAYFLDYIEGRLNKQDIEALEKFLLQKPDLQEELQNYEQSNINSELISFPQKESLKKFQFDSSPIQETNFSDFCIAWYENELNDSKAQELLEYIDKHPEHKKDFLLYSKLYLKPQPLIQFQHKAFLYKKIKARKLWYLNKFSWAAMAAGIALTITVYVKFVNQSKKENLPNKFITIQQYDSSVKKDTQNIITNIEKSKNAIASTFNTQKNSSKIKKTEASDPKLLASEIPVQREEINSIDPIQSKPLINQYEEQDIIAVMQDRLNYELAEEKSGYLIASQYGQLHLKDKNSRLSFFNILKAGIEGINFITNSNIKLDRKVNESGKVIAFSFESGLIQYHKN